MGEAGRDPEIATGTAGLLKIERRALAFIVAVLHRGRGRIPKAMRLEAAALNWAQRLLALLAREARDDRQTVLVEGGEHLAFDWRWLLDDRRERVEELARLAYARILWPAPSNPHGPHDASPANARRHQVRLILRLRYGIRPPR